ncbi:hypothetical protein [Gulosibacter chungangensis]|uniref:Serine/threonine protein kinase n=1 Tax=Gulosibacter chungangensis TaxID=979746 RepID=A0A7J5BDQ9_9MICO|nr:hypothetical protein [Gulosibacter chungangensis]KAB1644182.1 hypothetical protein F8O05_05250 [Gulosibacter chungangensis]
MFLDRNPKDEISTSLSPGDTVAGWRLVRPLTQDHREFVGVAEFPNTVATSGSDHWFGFGASARPRLQHRRIVIASEPSACAKLAEECSLRDEIGSEFVELAEETLVDGPHRIAIFPIRRVRTWSEVVATETDFPAGAIVTALVPVVEALQLAHENDIAHGTVSLHSCLIDEQGRPGLDDWGRAVRLADLATIKADLARSNDLRALGKIADALFAICTEEPTEQLRLLVDALCDGVTPKDAAGRLIDALFQWCEPEPLPVAALPGGHPSPTNSPNRTSGNREPGVGDLHLLTTNEDEVHEPLIAPPTPLSGRRFLLTSVQSAKSGLARLSGWVGNVRPAIWAGLGIVGLLVLLGGALLMSTQSVGTANPEPSTHVAAEAAETAEAAESLTSPETGFDTNLATDSPPEPPKTAIAAAPELVAARNACVTARDPQCLTELYAPDAPGLAADLDTLEAMEAPNSNSHDELQLSEQQEWLLAADLGDIELISGSEAGSLSLERTPDGWLLREIWLPDMSR